VAQRLATGKDANEQTSWDEERVLGDKDILYMHFGPVDEHF
jgi:hypothetical protein